MNDMAVRPIPIFTNMSATYARLSAILFEKSRLLAIHFWQCRNLRLKPKTKNFTTTTTTTSTTTR